MDLSFVAALVSWRGPAPFVFAPAPEDAADEIADVAARLTYGWGAIPATVRLTALDGGEGTRRTPRPGTPASPTPPRCSRARAPTSCP
ncbi:DUF1905 domain-containing protein [Brachybacterium phenoliresistens]|uniref:DUF1905 domain-containing protein n=1 Tax=Brachybacterium phenoliresistens TaxID=396014 RepID=UPI0004B64D77|nr:DUF1905 domain-containing protein [Brachybacterium phenoliresistens]